MQLFNLCVISAAANIAKEECVEIRHSRECWAWNMGKWVEPASVHEDAQEQEYCCCREAAGPSRDAGEKTTCGHFLCDVKKRFICHIQCLREYATDLEIICHMTD